MTGLKVDHVTADISNEAAGTTYSVTRLCEVLSRGGNSVKLHTLEPRASRGYDCPIVYYPRSRIGSRLGISPAMRNGIKLAARDSDVVHFHGLWTMPSIYPSWATRDSDAKLVFSPEGMLDQWALNWSRYRKKAFWWTLQKAALQEVDCIHVTSSLEAEAVREAGFHQPLANIPIGIDLPKEYLSEGTNGFRTLLYLGRLHPKKNVETLLEAWSLVAEEHPEWRLRIVGVGAEEYERELRELAVNLGLNRVAFEGPVFDREKSEAYRVADLVVLPTHSENFGIVVAEALSYGTPVVATKGAPWSGLERTGSGWWVESGAEALASAIRAAMGMDSRTLQEMGRRGRDWMLSDFSWQAVAARTTSLYEWLIGRSAKPSFVIDW